MRYSVLKRLVFPSNTNIDYIKKNWNVWCISRTTQKRPHSVCKSLTSACCWRPLKLRLSCWPGWACSAAPGSGCVCLCTEGGASGVCHTTNPVDAQLSKQVTVRQTNTPTVQHLKQYLYCPSTSVRPAAWKENPLFVFFLLFSQDSDTWSDVRVGVMTYDSQVHLYDLSPTLTRPHMLVITETDDLQLPVREGLLVPLSDCLHNVERLETYCRIHWMTDRVNDSLDNWFTHSLDEWLLYHILYIFIIYY